jgi:hypothetical protein
LRFECSMNAVRIRPPIVGGEGANRTIRQTQVLAGWDERNPTSGVRSPSSPSRERADVARRRLTFGVYAEAWLRDRDLKPRTRQHYRRLLDRQLLPTFEHVPSARAGVRRSARVPRRVATAVIVGDRRTRPHARDQEGLIRVCLSNVHST